MRRAEILRALARVQPRMKQLLAPALVVLASALPAQAKPISTPLSEVLERTRTVVVAQVTASWAETATLRVESVLWGSGAPGEWQVTGRPGRNPRGVAKQRVLAFLEQGRVWTFYAPLTTGPLERQALRLEGFYDYNAHLVRPNLLSLPELKRRLADPKATSERRFRGPLRFLNATGTALEDGPRLDLVVQGERAEVRGLESAALGGETGARLSWGFGADVELSVGTKERYLSFEARVSGVARDGSYETAFYVTRPALITRALYDEWCQGAASASPHFLVEVRVGAERRELDLGPHGLGTLHDDHGKRRIQGSSFEEGEFVLRLGGGRELRWRAGAAKQQLHPALGEGLRALLAGPRAGKLIDGPPTEASYRLVKIELR